MDICLRVLKESTTNKFDNHNRQKQCIDHINIVSRAHFFPTTFLEIAVYWKTLDLYHRNILASILLDCKTVVFFPQNQLKKR